MLINLGEVSESDSTLDRPYLGVVTENNDPLKLGRVKVSIDGLFEGANAPWIMRSSNSFLGGKATTGQFAVPEVGSKLKIEFPYNDIYSAEYTGFWNSKDTTPSDVTIDKILFAQVEGLKITYDKSAEILKVAHPSGTTITLKKNGDVEIKAANNIILNGQEGDVLTTATDPVCDYITGVPTVGVIKVKAGIS